MNYCPILKAGEEYVRARMFQNINIGFYYHNISHVERVVIAAKQIACNYKLSDKDLFVLLIACWFHDIVYHEIICGHELAGALEAETFLKENNVEIEIINSVKNCILSTRLPQAPTNLLEDIICDADLFHLGTDDFMRQSKMIKKEIEAVHQINITDKEWWNSTISLFENHQYHTDYCKDHLNNKKMNNLELLQENVQIEMKK